MTEGIVSKPNIIKIPNSNIIKLLTAKKKFNFEEIYIVEINKRSKKKWRKHINSNKTLLCIKGKIEVLIKKNDKIFKKSINEKNKLILTIKKNTFFRFFTSSTLNSSLLVFSEKKNKSLRTITL